MRFAGLMASSQMSKAALLCLNIEGAGGRVQSRISSAFKQLAAKSDRSETAVYVHMYSSGINFELLHTVLGYSV